MRTGKASQFVHLGRDLRVGCHGLPRRFFRAITHAQRVAVGQVNRGLGRADNAADCGSDGHADGTTDGPSLVHANFRADVSR